VAERWVLHARPQWSRRFFDMNGHEVARWLTRSFSALLRGKPMPAQAFALRWRTQRDQSTTAVLPLGRCGEPGHGRRLVRGPRIEGAYRSGLPGRAALQ